MKRFLLTIGMVVFSVLAVAPCGDAVAQPPDRLEHFRFVPRRSTLHVQGGFAGFDIRAHIFGDFDFITGYRQGEPRPVPSLDPYAAFANVDAKAINPTDFGPYEFDLDDTLNLSGLDGEVIPLGAPFDLYRFTGKEPQGGAVELHVVRFRQWLYIAGQSTAPPNSADFFEYDIRAIARHSRFADFNADDVVDAGDIAAWQAGFGDDGYSGADFLAAQRQQGEVMPSLDDFAAMAAGSINVAAIPEPATVSLLVGSLALFYSRGRRKRTR